jgi:CheY-like chemotaxis protein
MRSILINLGVDVVNQVDFCINGEEALELVALSYELGIGYSVIFTDFSMPIMDGVESTSKIRQMLDDYEGQPVIIGVTGHASVKYE